LAILCVCLARSVQDSGLALKTDRTDPKRVSQTVSDPLTGLTPVKPVQLNTAWTRERGAHRRIKCNKGKRNLYDEKIPLIASSTPTSPMSPPTLVSHPTWSQVTVAFLLVIVDWAILDVLRLGVGASLVLSALRCGAQLIIVTFVLRCVFNVESMWGVARLARRFLQYC
jgi:Uncharacterised protein family (UPF0014)